MVSFINSTSDSELSIFSVLAFLLQFSIWKNLSIVLYLSFTSLLSSLDSLTPVCV